jgi:hypothetical protein
MKLSSGLVALIAASVYCAQSTETGKQPVVAYKTVETGKPWTIGIYDANSKQLVSEKVVFNKNTKFVSGKGKKLYFDFTKHPTVVIYVYKGSPSPIDIAKVDDANEPYKSDPTFTSFVIKSEPITQDKALPGSKIKITADTVTIEPPKDTTRSMVIYTLDEAAKDMPFTIQAVSKAATGDIAYGKPISIKKHVPGKTYKLTIPQNKDFSIVRNSIPAIKERQSSVEIKAEQLKKDSELAIGYNILAKSKVNRQSMIENTAMVTIPVRKECIPASSAICKYGWTVQIHDKNKQYTGSQAFLESNQQTIKVPANKPFWVYVSQKGGVGSIVETEIPMSSPITKNNMMVIDQDGKAAIRTQMATFDTPKTPAKKTKSVGDNPREIYGEF